MAKKLMSVGDQAVARQLVSQAAALAQDIVLECAYAEDALKVVGVIQPDCVLMGISQHAPGALRAIKIIRQTHPEMRVVAVSHHNEAELHVAATEAGAAGYVSTENLSELFLRAGPELLALKPAPCRRSPLAPRK